MKEYRQGLAENALELFSQAIDKYDLHLPSLINRGYLFLELSLWDKALLDFEKAHSIDNNIDQINLYLGACNCNLGYYDIGIKQLEKQIERTPTMPDPYYNIAFALYVLDQYEEALEKIEKAIYLLGKKSKYFCLKAQVLEELGKHRETINSYNRAIELEEIPGDALVQKIEFLIRNNETEKAILGLNTMIDQYPFDGLLFLKRGSLYESSNLYEMAEKDYQSALQYGAIEAKQKIKKLKSLKS